MSGELAAKEVIPFAKGYLVERLGFNGLVEKYLAREAGPSQGMESYHTKEAKMRDDIFSKALLVKAYVISLAVSLCENPSLMSGSDIRTLQDIHEAEVKLELLYPSSLGHLKSGPKSKWPKGLMGTLEEMKSYREGCGKVIELYGGILEGS